MLEFSQFFMYIYYVVIRIKGDFPDLVSAKNGEIGEGLADDGDSIQEEVSEILFHEVILTLLLVALGFTKILYFIRIFEDFGLLV